MGTILIDQQSRHAMSATWSQERYLNENVRNTSEFLSSEMDLAYVRNFVATGSDVRFVARQIGTELNEHCWVIDRGAYIKYVNKIQHYTPEECVQKLHMPYTDAEGFIPGNLVYRFFLEKTAAANVVVPLISLREGLLIDMALGVDPQLQEEFFSQVIASAVNLGRKYHYDEPHSRHVADLCLTLFDALLHEHGMNRRERMMLEVAAILHDIGMFIQGADHHKHSQYLVANAEIFGLHREELDIIANVVRYHRGEPPAQTDVNINYIALQREERILVLKMASILRVADALDRGHSQHIKTITVDRKSETLVLHTGGGTYDLSLEHIGLEEKAGMFQDVFGYKVILT
jgi:exopolyphosphatase/guanosine-5'-triphosphate,3'-diphosphate pyrophosphatase